MCFTSIMVSGLWIYHCFYYSNTEKYKVALKFHGNCNEKCIDLRWVFSEKHSNGEFNIKTRLVAKEFQEDNWCFKWFIYIAKKMCAQY